MTDKRSVGDDVRSAATRFGLRGGAIAAALFGVSLQAPPPAAAGPPAEHDLLYQSLPQPMYGVVPIERERVIHGTVMLAETLEDDEDKVSIEIVGIGTDHGVGAGDQAVLVDLEIATTLDRCEEGRCYAVVEAEATEVLENPDVAVTIVEDSD